MSSKSARKPTYFQWLPLLLFLIGIGLRTLRMQWQPLWWDEGYSVYFATESLGQMAQLTAQDIHPPLYYSLLHFWLTFAGSASPLVLRAFSICVGLLALPIIGWLAHLFYPSRPRVMLWALLFLVLSPVHIFYSQEVRMYGLEMVLGMTSTAFFWRLARNEQRSEGRLSGNWVGYVVATTALLYTEYYAVFLPLAHGVWVFWYFRRQLRRGMLFASAWITVAAAYLPWLLYAVPQLIPYVSQKIVADADRPLGLLAYTLRHLLAFTAGHITPPLAWLSLLLWLAPISVMLVGTVALWHTRRSLAAKHRVPATVPGSPAVFLCLLLLIPATVGFALNLRLPFFPDGGERVLLFALPYCLLFIALGVDSLLGSDQRWARRVGGVALAGLLLGAFAGIWTFYTVPRHTQDDYRPLIRQTVQQGSDTDSVLTIFPWQVGYWRAYAPIWGRGDAHGPWPLLSPSSVWGTDVQNAVDAALTRGKLWFPAHLSLGGILEGEIERYLTDGASAPAGREVVNFEQRWYSTTTRLSGWVVASKPPLEEVTADFSVVQLRLAGLGETGIESANEVLPVRLAWDGIPSHELRVTLRLEDEANRVWAQRDYAPLGSWDSRQNVTQGADQVGLLIPSGVPPGFYRLAVGVGPAVDDWLYRATASNTSSGMAEIGIVQISAPSEPLPALRLPMQVMFDEPVTRGDVDFLGVSGFDPSVATLAGAELNLSIFVQVEYQSGEQELYVSLLDKQGNGVAGWEGWPLPDYPLKSWPPHTRMRLPVRFYLPAGLSPGPYQLASGLRSPDSEQRGLPVRLGQVPVVRREASFASPNPQHPLPDTPLFGSHAILLGYDSAAGVDGSIDLTFYWWVEQTLLPPHNVFVHLVSETGLFLGQDDGVPGRNQIAAPSNTWTPGEIIADPHRLVGPMPLPPGMVAQVGLYDPISGVRLPVSVNGEVVGDTLTIRIQ